jgi:DNA polymerase III epsilon subunit-like protein
VEWFEKLKLAQYKRIIPIAQNWPFDRAFLTAWLGRLTYEMIFDRHFRDTMALAASYNDIADLRGERIPFPKISLGALSKRFGIENPDPHRALGDCITTAAVYKNLLKYNDVGAPCPKCAEDNRADPGSPEQPAGCSNGGPDGGREGVATTLHGHTAWSGQSPDCSNVPVVGGAGG